MADVNEFFDALIEAAPEIASLRARHLEEYGELLGHLLIDDVQQWACERQLSDPASVDAMLRVMAEHLRPGDDPVCNIISVSFLEGLGGDPAKISEVQLRERLPSQLLAELQRMEAWRPK